MLLPREAIRNTPSVRLEVVKNRMPIATVTLDTDKVKRYTATALHSDSCGIVVPTPRGGNEIRSIIVPAVIGAIIAAATTVPAQAPTSSTVSYSTLRPARSRGRRGGRACAGLY